MLAITGLNTCPDIWVYQTTVNIIYKNVTEMFYYLRL